MLQKYFLGANSKDGFYSLYSSFPPAEDDFLHIIKAGPGGGKSGFMREIAAEAQRRGMDAELILCSGDFNSLDGLYIPALKTAWIDGTSPHSREPRAYASDADYIFLSDFLHGPLSEDDKAYVNLYTSAYREKYEKAYSLLRSACNLREGIFPAQPDDRQKAYISRRIDGILKRNRRREEINFSGTNPRFLSALCSGGELRLTEELNKLCKLAFRLNSLSGAGAWAMDYAAAAAEAGGEPLIKVPSPLSPRTLTALILPQREIAFTDNSWQPEGARNINLDSPAAALISRNEKRLLKDARGLEEGIMKLAFKKLAEAAAYHDKLEAVYRPYMDFDALSEFTQAYIQKLFK